MLLYSATSIVTSVSSRTGVILTIDELLDEEDVDVLLVLVLLVVVPLIVGLVDGVPSDGVGPSGGSPVCPGGGAVSPGGGAVCPGGGGSVCPAGAVFPFDVVDFPNGSSVAVVFVVV